MKKSNQKKIALSALTILMSSTLIAGATYAWFTTSVKTKVKIRSGTLAIQLHQYDKETDSYYDISDSEDALFSNENAWWEPGYTAYAAVKVVNTGYLALSYDVVIDCKSDDEEVVAASEKLAEVLDVYYYEGRGDEAPETRAELFANFECVGTLSELMAMGEAGVANGHLAGKTAADEEGEAHYAIIALHMQEQAGNEYQKLDAEYDISIYATQYTNEADFEDDQYDADAVNGYSVEPTEGISNVEVVFEGNTYDEALTVFKFEYVKPNRD